MNEFENYSVSEPNGDDTQQEFANPTEKKEKKSRKWVGVVALVLSCSLIGGLLGAGGILLYQKYNQEDTQAVADDDKKNTTTILQGNRENTVIDIADIDTGKVMTPAEVYAANVNSTVGITTSITTNYWGYQSTSAASGSGFIISEDGYIITNFHVIEDSSSITVALYSGEEYKATVIGYDESNDLAVLKIEAENLKPVILGDSDNLNVGDSVVAIGNPLGELTFSLTAGAISAKDREVTFSNNVTMDLLQTDCAINSGNSGGALFNMYGEVIGVTNAKYSSASGVSIDNIGFAIPINSIRVIVEDIMEKGYFAKPYLGISISDVSKDYEIYGLPQGAAIQQVVEGSPAEDAGLQVGDIVTAVGETAVTSSDELIDIVSNAQIGEKLKLTIYRKGEVLEITVTVGEQIQSALENQDTQQSSPNKAPGNSGGRR